MNIRKATIEDIDLLIKLRIDYLLTDIGSLSRAEESAIRLQLKTYFLEHINNNFVAILAEEAGKVLGTAFLAIAEKPANPTFLTGKTGTLLNVMTYPEYQKKGIAGKVVTTIIKEAKHLGVSSLDLLATQAGKSLYTKLGFAESPEYTAMKLKL